MEVEEEARRARLGGWGWVSRRGRGTGKGDGEAGRAGLGLAVRLPAKMGRGGATVLSSCREATGEVGRTGERDGRTLRFSRLTVAAVQLLGDEIIWARPLVNGTGVTASSASGAFFAETLE